MISILFLILKGIDIKSVDPSQVCDCCEPIKIIYGPTSVLLNVPSDMSIKEYVCTFRDPDHVKLTILGGHMSSDVQVCTPDYMVPHHCGK